jgi:hypothetical protein
VGHLYIVKEDYGKMELVPNLLDDAVSTTQNHGSRSSDAKYLEKAQQETAG